MAVFGFEVTRVVKQKRVVAVEAASIAEAHEKARRDDVLENQSGKWEDGSVLLAYLPHPAEYIKDGTVPAEVSGQVVEAIEAVTSGSELVKSGTGPLDVPCKKCGAPAGGQCVTPSGNVAYGAHSARLMAYNKAKYNKAKKEEPVAV